MVGAVGRRLRLSWRGEGDDVIRYIRSLGGGYNQKLNALEFISLSY